MTDPTSNEIEQLKKRLDRVENRLGWLQIFAAILVVLVVLNMFPALSGPLNFILVPAVILLAAVGAIRFIMWLLE